MGDVRAAVDDFTARAATRESTAATTRRCGRCWISGGALSWMDRDRSLAAVEQALAFAPRLDDDALQAHVRGSHGVQRILSRGWRDEDAEACRLAIDAVRRGGERRHLSLHVGHYAYLQSHRSEYRAAAAPLRKGCGLALEVGDAYHYMTCQFHRAWAFLHLGEWGELRRVLRDGLEMAERNGHDLWARAFRFQTAWLLIHVCDFAGARALCERELRPGARGPARENSSARSSSGSPSSGRGGTGGPACIRGSHRPAGDRTGSP